LVVRTQGFFIPYVTANHKFKIKGDDQVDVYLNKNGNDPTGKVRGQILVLLLLI